MKRFLIGLLYESGTPSRTGLAALILVIMPLFAVLLLTGYLVVKEKQFAYYQEFIAAVEWFTTTGCGLLGANKLINSKVNSGEGQPFIKNNGDGHG